MAFFTKLYNKIMIWAKHRHAPYYLALLSFAESSFFPIPPDFMLAPMVIAKPERGWWYAFITTLTSVLGALLGYIIGVFFLALIYPLLVHFGYAASYHEVSQWFVRWNFWVMIFAGFAFIPYKLFTIAAGAAHISIIPFIFGSIVGRGGRFFLVTAVLLWKGEAVEKFLVRYLEHLGWLTVGIVILVFGVYQVH